MNVMMIDQWIAKEWYDEFENGAIFYLIRS
jgi:hypothetical protein